MRRLRNWREDRFYRRVVRQLPALRLEAPNGLRWYVRPGDEFIGASIVRTGAFEPEKVSAVLELLASENIRIDHLIDVGANVGTTTIEVLRQQPGVTATAFEPEPLNFQLLRLNLIANGLESRVDVHQLALTDTAGPVTLELAPSNFGDHRVRSGAAELPDMYEEERRPTVSVAGMPLDEVPGVKASSNSLIFIDVQGFEAHVLSGASRLLAHRPPLAVEFWPYGLDRMGARHRYYNALAPYGRLFEIKATPARSLSHDELDGLASHLGPVGHTDLLALP